MRRTPEYAGLSIAAFLIAFNPSLNILPRGVAARIGHGQKQTPGSYLVPCASICLNPSAHFPISFCELFAAFAPRRCSRGMHSRCCLLSQCSIMACVQPCFDFPQQTIGSASPFFCTGFQTLHHNNLHISGRRRLEVDYWVCMLYRNAGVQKMSTYVDWARGTVTRRCQRILFTA